MSASTLNVSQTSDEHLETDESTSEPPRRPKQPYPRPLDHASARDVVLLLIAFRVLNALTIRTFFQPDEFFQALEPAWQTVFGQASGAWITWVWSPVSLQYDATTNETKEWKEHLRSALHPAIFSGTYFAADSLARWLSLNPTSRAELLIAAPATIQAILSAISDYYTWKLADLVYGEKSLNTCAVLVLTIVSPWQWFCSTRTFSNCLETCLTVFALYNWRWAWSTSRSLSADKKDAKYQFQSPNPASAGGGVGSTSSLRMCLMSAAFACIIRPTNILIWITLACFALFQRTRGLSSYAPQEKRLFRIWHRLRLSLRLGHRERLDFLRETLLCGSTVFAVSIVADRLYYGSWTLPPVRFFYVNVIQSLAGFYGQNDWHYYLTQGYPLLLTTALPFTLPGIYSAFAGQPISKQPSPNGGILHQLACISLVVPAFLSLLSHKEVRFIYPILPCLHVLTAPGLVFYFGPALDNNSSNFDLSRASIFMRRILLACLLSINVLIATYTTMVHGQGALAVIDYLRHQYSIHYVSDPVHQSDSDIMTVGFLMPCHSTPWRSHLVFSGINAWALRCEPPLNITSEEKSFYLDEADQFYADPTLWLRSNMARHPPRPKKLFKSKGSPKHARGMIYADSRAIGWKESKREWPEYLVFFEQLEILMQIQLRNSDYSECWRSFNTRWHDDWRRRGDIIVWCLNPERRLKTSQSSAWSKSKLASQATSTMVDIGNKAQRLIGIEKFSNGDKSREKSEINRWWGWV